MSAVAARDAIDATVAYLHGEHLVDPQVSADAVWADLMSENLLHHIRHTADGMTTRSHDQVEWLHQLFRDYFLGEFLVSLSFDPAEPRLRHVKMTLRLAPAATVQACLISLALAPSLTQKRVLFDEFRAFGDLRQALFTQLRRDEIEAMLLDGVDALMDEAVVQEEDLKRAALYFYSPRLPEG
ncbi:hypothetical protein DVJ83_17540 (plasmid) [Deinococcus wulumuqiensis]|uniref:Uncharacterized protein n=1 Tax=Deinococcus wulumuqiensis TaxID=980427 RepID=A0A345IMJ0_9DEIO|nr:hypothetical protein [Deinococcus wulumuqiensis]AXH00913.1 hypothetical protein DVJ83_17540 [Deinococcus wulumuqiensis]